MSNESLESLKEKLNKLVNIKDICLHEGEVLETSRQLDDLLNSYYYDFGQDYKI